MGTDTGRHRSGTRNFGPVLILALAAPTVLQAQENATEEVQQSAPTVQKAGYWPAADTEAWSCRLCPEPGRRKGTLTAGAGYVSDASEKFGDKTGLDEDEPFGILQAEVSVNDGQTGYFRAEATNLALESRRLLLEGGRQGEYGLALSYSSLPHFIAEGARTAYLNPGAEELRLPATWLQQSSTRAMNIASHLQTLPSGIDRHEYRAGGNYQKPQHWHYELDYRRTEQDGLRLQGAAFLTSGTTLPMPVDRVTDRLDAAVSYVERDWQIQASYHGSTFKNKSSFVIWDNPFVPLAPGAERGLLAQEPDNSFNQLSLSGRWRILPVLNTSAQVSMGRMEQDEPFAAPTINPEIGNIASPRAALDGQVDILSTRIQAVAQARNNLTLTGEAYLEDRDNDTPRDLYLQVSNDLTLARARFNRPYSYERTGSRLRADYRANPALQFSTGIGREEFERTWQEVEKTGTTEYWAQVRAEPASSVNIRLKIGREQRRFIDGYESLPDLVSSENPLLRKFNLSERDRNAVRTHLTFTPADTLSVSWSVDYALDEYAEGYVGLTEAREFSQTLDVSGTPVEKLTLYGFLTRQRIDSHQDGSSAFSIPDWSGRQQDAIDTAGFGIELRDLGPFEIGLELGYSAGQGKMEVATRNPATGFPDLETELASLKVFGLYAIDEKLSLRLDYWYEKFRSEDFFIDQVEPATIPGWLGAGQVSPEYEVHLIGLGAVYRF